MIWPASLTTAPTTLAATLLAFARKLSGWRSEGRLVIAIWFCIAVISPLSAAQAEELPPTDNVSSPLLISSLTQRLETITATRSAFTQTKTIPHLLRPLVSEGSFLYVKGRGIVWVTTQPFESTFVISKAGILRFTSDGTASKIDASDNPVANSFSKAFLSLFGGDAKELSENFDIQGTFSDQGWSLSLLARPQLARFIEKISLRGDEVVERLEISEPSGDRSVIEFRNILKNGAQFSEVTLSKTEEKLLSGGFSR